MNAIYLWGLWMPKGGLGEVAKREKGKGICISGVVG